MFNNLDQLEWYFFNVSATNATAFTFFSLHLVTPSYLMYLCSFSGQKNWLSLFTLQQTCMDLLPLKIIAFTQVLTLIGFYWSDQDTKFLVLVHVHGKHSKRKFSGPLLSVISGFYISCRFPYMLSTGRNLKEVASLAWNMLIMCSPVLLNKESLKKTS